MHRVAYLAGSLLTALLVTAASAQTPDLNRPEIQALRSEFLQRRDAIDTTRRMVLEAMLSKQLEEQQQQQRQAKIRGNTTRHADATQAIALFEKALADLEKEDRFDFPKNVRPALERMLALCVRAREAEEETRTATRKALDNTFIARFTALLEQQDMHGLDRQQVQTHWQAVLDRITPAEPAEHAAPPADIPAPAAGAATDGPVPPTDDTVLQVRGEAANWTPVADMEFTVQTMEIIALPLFDLTETETRTGTGLESGAPWRASLKPLRPFARPAGAPPAMRLRSIPGRHPVDVVEWPSQRNGWKIVLRIRPPASGTSLHGGLLEIDAAAAGAKP